MKQTLFALILIVPLMAQQQVGDRTYRGTHDFSRAAVTGMAGGGIACIDNSLTAPTGLSVTPTGTPGTTTYTYYVADTKPSSGGYAVSGVASTTTGNATLSGTNYNVVAWTSINGHTYTIYRASGGASSGALGTVTASGTSASYNDVGGTATGSVPITGVTAYSCSPSSVPSSLTAGTLISLVSTTIGLTGGSTVAVGSLSSVPLKLSDGTSAIPGGYIQPGAANLFVYDGTVARAVGPTPSSAYTCSVSGTSATCVHNLGNQYPNYQCVDANNYYLGSVGSAGNVNQVVGTSTTTLTIGFDASIPSGAKCILTTPDHMGPQGAAGAGVPTGGLAGQVLVKNSNSDLDTKWVDASNGGLPFCLPSADGRNMCLVTDFVGYTTTPPGSAGNVLGPVPFFVNGNAISNNYVNGAGQFPHVGIFRLGNTNTSVGNYASLSLATGAPLVPFPYQTDLANATALWEEDWIFSLTQTTNVHADLGFATSGTNATENVSSYFVGIRFDSSLSDTNFMFGANGTFVSSGVAADTGWHHLKIKNTAVGTISMSLDGGTAVTACASGCTITATWQSAQRMTPAALIEAVTNAQANTLDLDFFGFVMTGITR